MRARFRQDAAALFALWALAVAQPLFDLLGRSPEFFVAHAVGRTEILLMVSGLVLLLPAIVLAAARLAGAFGLGAAIAALVFAIAIQALKQAGLQTSIIAMPIAAGIGASAALAYHRFGPVRSFVSLLSPAIVVVPAIFLTTPSIRQLMSPPRRIQGPEVRRKPDADRPGPVLMVVIDETSLVSLVDAEGKIDPVLYPSLARLARDGIWFRNATAVSDHTQWAIPPIVSGRYPAPDLLPNSAHYPDTLFTLLGQTHRLVVVEAVTRLCPSHFCARLFNPLADRLTVVASDLWIVYLHILLPDDVRARLPVLTSGWAGFGAADARAEERDAPASPPVRRSRLQIADNFADWITPDDPQPTFYFFHTALSHSPWQWLPSGQLNATRAPVPGDDAWSWTGDGWGVAQYYQRHLLQLGLVDRVIGRIIARLEAAELYDETLVVITADHGISFRPNGRRRDFSEESAAEIMRVPLIVKIPESLSVTVPFTSIGGQRISDRNAETVDIAPTVVDVLGFEMSWKADGVSLLDTRTERDSKQMFFAAAQQTRSYGRDGPDAAPAIQRKLHLFGGPDNFYRVPRPDRFADLVGRPLTELRIADGGGEVTVKSLSAFEQIVNAPDAAPFDVAGEIPQPKSPNDATYVALSVNGVVRAVTRTWSSNPRQWLATPPLDAWREGPNDVKVFIVDADALGPLLRRTNQSEPPRAPPQ